MTGRLLFSGNSLAQAVLAAARHFRLDPDRLAYVTRAKETGFLRSPRIVIEVDPAAPLLADQPKSPAPQVTAPTARPFSRISPVREQELLDVAAHAAAVCRSTGEEVFSQELNPAERRIVHSAIAELGLRTESLGEERLKRMRIYAAPAVAESR
jgi:R3H domain